MAQNQAPQTTSSGSSKNTIILVVVIVIVVCVIGAGVGGYLILKKLKTAAKNKIQQTITSPSGMGGALENDNGDAQNVDQAAEDFKKVEDLELSDNSLKALDTDLRPVLQSVFGEAKITNYETDYLALGTGQQFLEYTVSRNIVSKDLNTLLGALKQAGYTVGSSSQDKDGSSIVAEKAGLTLDITYWHDDSTIRVVSTSAAEGTNTEE